MRFIDGFKRHGLVSASIGENDIDLAVITFDALVERREVSKVCNVTLHADRTVTYLADGLIEQLLPPSGDVYLGAFLCEALCRRQPDTVAPAGYHHDLAFESIRHCETSFRKWSVSPFKIWRYSPLCKLEEEK